VLHTIVFFVLDGTRERNPYPAVTNGLHRG
jgi:hypothetical protein